MAIIEKPSSTSGIFASAEEARQLGTPVIDVPVSEFVETLEHPEVQEVIQSAVECSTAQGAPPAHA